MFQMDWRIQVHIPLILRELFRNAWLVILAGIIAAIGVFSYGTFAYKPVYTSEVTFSVSPKSSGSYVGFYSSLNAANEMASVFSEVFSSDVLKRMIKEELTDSNLSFSVSASIVEDTNILSVKATADTPANAHEVMQAVLRDYGEVSDYLFGGVVLDTIRSPHVPLVPSNPFNTLKKVVVGAFFAMVFMCAVIVFLSVIRQTVKTVDGGKYYLHEAPLGILFKESRGFVNNEKRKGLLITKTNTSFRYVESVYQVSQKIRQKMSKNAHKVLIVTSVAENEGKTTVAANIALALSKHGYKVALVDMDLRRPALHKFFAEMKRGYDLMDSINNGIPKDADSSFMLFTISGEVKNVGKLLHARALERFLNSLKEKVDYVILDTPPYTAVADTGMLLKHADCALQIVRQDWVPGGVVSAITSEIAESGTEYLGYVMNYYIEDSSDKAHGYSGKYGKYGKYGRTDDKTEEEAV